MQRCCGRTRQACAATWQKRSFSSAASMRRCGITRRRPTRARRIAAVALDALACIAPGATIMDNGTVLALRHRWAKEIGRAIAPLVAVPHDGSRKLRVGYVSSFFGARNWTKPVFGVINQHDRTRFEIHLLSDHEDPSESSGYQDHAEDRIWRTASSTTTTEALWQGVPVLCFDGDRWASRTSRSLLLAAGLADWVKRDRTDYVAAANDLALAPETPNRLAALRASMRDWLQASPVCDCKALCRELETLYLAGDAR